MKLFSKTLLVVYVLFLLWLVLFKTSLDFLSVVLNYQSRSLNLIPFAGYTNGKREVIDNLIAFIPLGLLLGINFKHTSFRRKLSFVLFFSTMLETVQFVLAIGTTDITDVIMNTLGGLIGLTLYKVSSKRIDNNKLDWLVSAMLAVLLTLFLILRFFFLRVRY